VVRGAWCVVRGAWCVNDCHLTLANPQLIPSSILMSPIQTTALLVTLLSEAGGMILYLTLRRPRTISRWRVVAVVLGVNLITHPLFWVTFPMIGLPFLPRLYLAESIVALIEGIVYRRLCRFRWIEAMALGLALNAFSTVVGIVLWQVWLG
jgi:hypothetical protein